MQVFFSMGWVRFFHSSTHDDVNFASEKLPSFPVKFNGIDPLAKLLLICSVAQMPNCYIELSAFSADVKHSVLGLAVASSRASSLGETSVLFPDILVNWWSHAVRKMSDSSYNGQSVQSGPSMSMIDNSRGSIGIGNYKGVMLCNRPFGGTAGNRLQSIVLWLQVLISAIKSYGTSGPYRRRSETGWGYGVKRFHMWSNLRCDWCECDNIQ